MKYKLINKVTNEEYTCEKVTINEFDYYVSDEKVFENEVYAKCSFTGDISKTRNGQISHKVIATNNLSIDLPQVISLNGFVKGYNKSQETHPNSDEDMASFAKFSKDYFYTHLFDGDFEACLKLWKSQQAKTIYYAK